MFSKRFQLYVPMVLLLGGMLASVSAFAGSAAIGSVASSTNATVGGQPLLPDTAIFSGDSLQVRDGVALVALDNGSHMTLGLNTVASFLRDSKAVTVDLSQGTVSLFRPNDQAAVRVKVGTYSIVPVKGFKTLGEIAMVNGSLVVTARQGALRVEGSGSPIEVAQGKTVTISPKAGRSPQEGGHQRLGGVSTSTALEGGALGAGAVAAVLAGIGLSRAGDAKDNAAAAITAANQADADAKAATTAATNAANVANLAGCAEDTVFRRLGGTGPSPYTPPSGFTCPAGTP